MPEPRSLNDNLAVTQESATQRRSPYPGLRPFERDERTFFFGRDRDAELLGNKIFASRLTLFFGQSGRGKSSLLKTLVIPQLEAEGARVFSFEEWGVPDPLTLLLQRLGQLTGKDAKVDDEETLSGPSTAPARRRAKDSVLLEVVRRLTAYDPRPLVIVLDQFEELLLRHARSLETVRRELAALVRDQMLDLRIVISLREEFLAALEPFRRDIPGLFDSNYRLERLSDEALREVIVKPAAAVGVEVETALVDALFHDLQAEPNTVPAAGQADQTQMGAGNAAPAASVAEVAVELPLLQLIMVALWREAAKTSRTIISLDLYRSLGGWRNILEAYVEQVTPSSYRDRLLTAQLLQHLAPSSGYKLSFSADDLGQITGHSHDRVSGILRDLSRAGILRLREFRDTSLYELQHDAFIAVLTPWRDHVLRQWKRTKALLGVAGLIILVAASAAFFQIGLVQERERQTRWITETRLLELDQLQDPRSYKREAPDRLNAATRHLLYETRGPSGARMERLAAMLRRFERHIPPDHGFYYSTESKFLFEEPPADWPFVLEYAAGRKFHSTEEITDAEALFRSNWQDMAGKLLDLWGLPAPVSLRIKNSQILDSDTIRLTNGKGDEIKVNVGQHFDTDVYAMVDEGRLRGAAREFFDHFKSSWIRVPEWQHGTFYAVPRWSLPVWRTTTPDPASDGTASIALALATALTKNPSVLLTDDVVELLLERLSKTFPVTVAEARAARGSRLRNDLLEHVKGDNSLLYLEMVLDALARYRAADSAEVASRVLDSIDQPLSSREGWAPQRLEGPQPPTDPPKKPSDLLAKAFDRAALRFQPPESRLIRIYLGRELWDKVTAAWSVEGGVVAQLSEFRDRFTKRFGVEPFNIQFRRETNDWPVSSTAFRVAMLNQTSKNQDTREIDIAQSSGSFISQIIDEVEASSSWLRPFLITAESTKDLVEAAPAGLGQWLKARFSITDLKLLLRSVIATDPNENGSRTTPQNTVRNADWLLPALAFFEPVAGLDTEQLSLALRELQAAKAEVLAGSQSAPLENGNLASGVEALQQGKIEEAQSLFGDREQRLKNRTAFIRAYAARFPAWRLKRLTGLCGNLKSVLLLRNERIDLEDVLSGILPQDDLLQFRLCLYAEYKRQKREADRDRMLKLLMFAHSDFSEWKPAQAAWFGKQLFQTFQAGRDPQDNFTFALKLLDSAMRRMVSADALNLFYDAKSLCADKRRYVPCTELLDRLTEARPADLALDRAGILSYEERAQDAERAIRYLEIYQQSLAQNNSVTVPSRTDEFARITRIRAEITIAAFDPSPNWARIEQNLKLFLASAKETDLLADAYTLYIKLLHWTERYEEAVQINVDIPASIRTRDESNFDSMRFLSALLTLNAEAVKAAADRLMIRAQSKDFAPESTLAAMLSKAQNWREMARTMALSDHPYKRLYSALFHSMMEGKDQENARAFLEERWQEISPQTWNDRLRDGDYLVWYEIVLGYYLDKPEVDRNGLMMALRDDQVFARSRFATLPLPRLGMLCEFHFYDAIKARAAGRMRDARTAFEAVLATGHRNYTEFAVALYLLDREFSR